MSFMKRLLEINNVLKKQNSSIFSLSPSKGGKKGKLVKNKISISNGVANHMFSGQNIFYSSPRPLHKQPTLPLSVYLPAVTHLLLFQNARIVTSRRCVPGRVDSAKKTCILLYLISYVSLNYRLCIK